VFAWFLAPAAVSEAKWVTLDVPIRRNNSQANDLATVFETSPVSALADSEQTFPSPEEILNQNAIV
jgi:hypothetical protein